MLTKLSLRQKSRFLIKKKNVYQLLTTAISLQRGLHLVAILTSLLLLEEKCGEGVRSLQTFE